MIRPSASDLCVVALATVVVVVGAQRFAGSWNDASRLATVESLVDYQTLAIDQSLFTQATNDKLFIHGHFYSDKSPVPAVLMAGVYLVLQWTTGLVARQQPGWFCYALTVGFAGLAYVVAVWCVWRLARRLLPQPALRLLLVASFAMATVALAYTRQVNSHILFLGVASPLMLGLARLAQRPALAGRGLLLGLGTLAGFGYTIDLAVGPVLLVCLVPLIAYRTRSLKSVAAFALAVLPWLVAHHTLNYAVGGTLRPANAVPAHSQWPGCPFPPDALTGARVRGLDWLAKYGLKLLIGEHGWFLHNLPLLALVPGVVTLLRRRGHDLPEVLFCCSWATGSWLAYALMSMDFAGMCCSIRWFVPLLAPSYYLLAVLLREEPRSTGGIVILSGWGAVLGWLAWWQGPWKNVGPVLWVLCTGALVTWAGWSWWRHCQDRRGRSTTGFALVKKAA